MPRLNVQKDGVTVSERRTLNFIAGTNVTITMTDDNTGNQVDIQFDASGGGVTDHGLLTGLADDDHTQYIRHAIATAAGSLLRSSGAGAFAELGIGANGTILTSDGSTFSWQAPGAATHPAIVSHMKWGVD